MELEQCFAQCERLISEGSSSFYKAFSLLPSPRREAVYVIYAFCRMIDDAVDEPEKAPYTLDELEMRLRALKDAEGHFIWPALRWLFASFPLDHTPFLLQMEGQRRDLWLVRYETMEQLEHYCRLVAGTVGEMLLPVLHEQPTVRVAEAGIYLGKAMQIVNIVRDVGEDQARGRRYLPLELMERHGYSEADFAARRVNPAFLRMIAELEQVAAAWFGKGMQDLDTYPPDSAFSIELAARFYRAILDEAIAGGCQVYTRRTIVGSAAKATIFVELCGKYKALPGNPPGIVAV